MSGSRTSQASRSRFMVVRSRTSGAITGLWHLATPAWPARSGAWQDMAVDHLEHCQRLEEEVERFANTLQVADLSLRVPGCPEWSVGELTGHLGTIHRWAEHLVRVLAPERVPSEQMGLGEPGSSPEWVRAGGATLVSTLRAADPEAGMWAWGADPHVRFWSRRQLHETMVHRVDLEQAVGADPVVDSAVAADAIDELLANLPRAVYFSPLVANLTGNGEALSFVAEDAGRSWSVTFAPDGFSVKDGHGERADATVTGGAFPLLLVLYRRARTEGSGLAVRGEARLFDFWLENSALD